MLLIPRRSGWNSIKIQASLVGKLFGNCQSFFMLAVKASIHFLLLVYASNFRFDDPVYAYLLGSKAFQIRTRLLFLKFFRGSLLKKTVIIFAYCMSFAICLVILNLLSNKTPRYLYSDTIGISG